MNSLNSQILHVSNSILKKISISSNKTPSFKTWARSAKITPSFIGLRLKVHNGKDFIPLIVSSEMVGYRLGEFISTRSKYEFKKKRKKK